MTDTAGSSSRSSTLEPVDEFVVENNKESMSSHIQRQQWEAFFKPEYTFESFIHGSTKPLTNNARHKRNIDKLMTGMSAPSSVSSSRQDLASLMNAPQPPLSTRPSSHNLSIRPALGGGGFTSTASSVLTTGTTALPTLPNMTGGLSQNTSDSTTGPSLSDEGMLKERLELLRKIRMQGKGSNHKRNRNSSSDIAASGDSSRAERPGILTDEEDNRRQSFIFETTARWKQQFTIAAKQVGIDRKADDSISIISDNGTFDIVEKNSETDETKEGENKEIGDSCLLACYRRPSLLCFILGFFCPLFWLFGAIHFSTCANRQTPAIRRTDHVWRRRSRIAFGLTMVGLMIALIVIFVLNPETVGYRQSRQYNDSTAH